MHGQTTNSPERERKQRDGSERPPPPRVKRLLWQAGRNETGDEHALPVGIGASLLDSAQRKLIGGFGEAPLAVDLLEFSQAPRQPVRRASSGSVISAASERCCVSIA